MKLHSLNPFLRGYITAAFWTSEFAEGSGDYEENGNAPELFAELAPEALERATADCERFEEENEPLLSDAYAIREDYHFGNAGHDFWLSRNGHGAGFFDRDLGDTGTALQSAARAFGMCDLYRGDDGKLYL